jgi:hypothetical protein
MLKSISENIRDFFAKKKNKTRRNNGMCKEKCCESANVQKLKALTDGDKKTLGGNVIAEVEKFLGTKGLVGADFKIDATIKLEVDGFNLGIEISYPPLSIKPV